MTALAWHTLGGDQLAAGDDWMYVIAHDDGQAGSHRLVDHESPFLINTGQDERFCQRVKDWVFFNLTETVKVNAGRFARIGLWILSI